MGYGIMPYAVDLDAVRRVFGSKDESLLQAVIAAQDLPDDDTDDEGDWGDEEPDDDDEDGEVASSQEVLRRIVMGEPFARGCVSKYGYVFKSLVEHLGTMLDNEQWEGTRSEFLDGFDAVLGKLGIPAELYRANVHLIGRTDTVPLPPRTDFPGIGHLTKDEVIAVGKALDALDPAAVRAASGGIRVRKREIDADFVVKCLDEIRAWCRECETTGRALVTFYH